MSENSIQIPNTIFNIGLSAYEISLYVTILKNANECGLCTKGTKLLSKESGMSIGTISRTKQSLIKPRKELNGKALIVIESIVHKDGGNGVDNIFINRILEV
jgi:hypothetical protein